MHITTHSSFCVVYFSPRNSTEPRKVNMEAAEESTVLEVTEVREREWLKVNCAKNHSGATCAAITQVVLECISSELGIESHSAKPLSYINLLKCTCVCLFDALTSSAALNVFPEE
jgi:hypothetical protein